MYVLESQTMLYLAPDIWKYIAFCGVFIKGSLYVIICTTVLHKKLCNEIGKLIIADFPFVIIPYNHIISHKVEI